MAEHLLGKEVVAALRETIVERAERLRAAGVAPTLALVRVGERPDDLSYERTATKRAADLGIEVQSVVLPPSASQRELSDALDRISADPTVHGCLVFRPLPDGINEAEVFTHLDPAKDVDGITNKSLAGVFTDVDEGFAPATARACLEMLDHYQIPIQGKHAVVIGRSLVIGKPVAMLLLRRHASVTLLHSRTEDLPGICRGADIVVCATGRARAYGADCFSAGQTVLDVGINFDQEGKLCGDVDYEAVEPLVGAITPVPGGIGTVTTSALLLHTVIAAERIVADTE